MNTDDQKIAEVWRTISNFESLIEVLHHLELRKGWLGEKEREELIQRWQEMNKNRRAAT